MVIAIKDDAIASMVRFADPRLFERFNLPEPVNG